MEKLKITTLSRLHTLILLSSSSRHGYELIKELEHGLGKKVSAGEVYPFLKELKRLGYVSIESTGERDTKTYKLTVKGKKFVEDVLTNVSVVIESMIASKVTSCAHCSCKVYGKSHVKKIKEKEFHFCCKYCAEAFGFGDCHV